MGNRRIFLKDLAVMAGAIQLAPSMFAGGSNVASDNLHVSIFSKHLQFLDYAQCGQKAAELGFDGVDLTVRPKGHVLPENVSRDLPIAVADIRKSGVDCNMITTSIESVDNEEDVRILQAASKAGIKYYRTGWFRYRKNVPLTTSITHFQKEVQDLSILNKNLDLIGCYQNHAGTKVGASFWEIYQLLQDVDPKYFGTQYDIRHASVEGGHSWVNGLNLLKDKIKMIVLKDYRWEKKKGKWKLINVPIGEGMVDFVKYFKLLKGYGINPPVSLHLEYPLGGAEKGKYTIDVNESVVYKAMEKDLVTIRKMWSQA